MRGEVLRSPPLPYASNDFIHTTSIIRDITNHLSDIHVRSLLHTNFPNLSYQISLPFISEPVTLLSNIWQSSQFSQNSFQISVSFFYLVLLTSNQCSPQFHSEISGLPLRSLGLPLNKLVISFQTTLMLLLDVVHLPCRSI